MKKIIIALVLAIFTVGTVDAQLSDKEIKKEAKKEAKRLQKQGWQVLPGSLGLEGQLFNSMKAQNEKDNENNSKYIVGREKGIGGNYSAAKLSATTRARADIAAQLGTQIDEKIKENTANDQLENDEAESAMKAVGAAIQNISHKLSRTKTVSEMHRKLSNGNTEVSVVIVYDAKLAEKAIKQATREALMQESEEIAKKMEKLLDL